MKRPAYFVLLTLLSVLLTACGKDEPQPDVMLFAATDGITGVELWRTDGTEEGTVRVKDINPSGSSSPSGFTLFNGAWYFQASDGITGVELWKTDGTETGTVRVKDINSNLGAGSFPNGF